MKLIFLFTNGTKFSLNLPAKVNRKNVLTVLAAFQAFCLKYIEDHKRYASGITTFKIPTHRPAWIGLDTGEGSVLPIYDEAGNVARIKGYSILNKTGKGKDMVLSANNDFPRFMWSKMTILLGEVEQCQRLVMPVPVLDRVLSETIEKRNEAKERAAIKTLASGEAKTGVQSVNVESVLAD